MTTPATRLLETGSTGQAARGPARTRARKPSWLRVKAPWGEGFSRLRRLIHGQKLNTVCESAHCPNIGECWNRGTATFMLLGETCTRNCTYCNVTFGKPLLPPDLGEPERVARSVRAMGLRHAVLTSVARDDLPDGGAAQFARTIEALRWLAPECRVEVLIPDFRGHEGPLRTVLEAGPDVMNHNLETVARLQKVVRRSGGYGRSLEVIRRTRAWQPEIVTKSGLMVGLGETREELGQALKDLREAGCDILTVGQYLRPTMAHHPMERYLHPDEFVEIREEALSLGFVHAECGPLVRSSYHAEEQADAAAGA